GALPVTARLPAYSCTAVGANWMSTFADEAAGIDSDGFVTSENPSPVTAAVPVKAAVPVFCTLTDSGFIVPMACGPKTSVGAAAICGARIENVALLASDGFASHASLTRTSAVVVDRAGTVHGMMPP